MNLPRFERTLNEINNFGALDKGVTRLAYSQEEKMATEHFIRLCREEGMQVRVDSCGNVIARREGRHSNLPVVAVGSHLDTVIEGGKYDGAIGVIAGLEVIRTLNEQQIETEHPIEIIAFACEESARFGVSTLGSKAMTGKLEKESIENIRDKNGITIPQAFLDYSLCFDKIEESKRETKEFKVFFELHIEQGPVLEAKRKQVGIVHGIAAPTRFHLRVQGKASHSGSTPMDQRKDALLGAAEIALKLEEAAKKESVHGTVATVGVFEVGPGAMNVVPGVVEMKVDIRGTSTKSKEVVRESLSRAIESVKKSRGLEVLCTLLGDEEPVGLNNEVADFLAFTCERMGISHLRMPSGAGHDSMNMAKICPTGLIFVPSRDGVSHHPDEFTDLKDIMPGIALLGEAVIRWAIGNKTLQHSKPQQRWGEVM